MKDRVLAVALAVVVSSVVAPAEAGVLHGLVNVGKVVIRTPGSAVKATIDGVRVGVKTGGVVFGLSLLARLAGYKTGV